LLSKCVQNGHFKKVFLVYFRLFFCEIRCVIRPGQLFQLLESHQDGDGTFVVALYQNGHSLHFMHRTNLQNIKLLQNPIPHIHKNIGAYKNFLNFGKIQGMENNTDVDKVTPLDLLSSKNYTSKEIRDERFDICKQCRYLSKPTYTCKKCGCFMAMKTWLKDAQCPCYRW
jgi:hypothetical protein